MSDMMKWQIIFVNKNGNTEPLAQFEFGDDMEEFWNSEYFRKEYLTGRPIMQYYSFAEGKWEEHKCEK